MCALRYGSHTTRAYKLIILVSLSFPQNPHQFVPRMQDVLSRFLPVLALARDKVEIKIKRETDREREAVREVLCAVVHFVDWDR